ncbi:MAG: tRNA pseudouridine(38-40) synthase TruA [Negativicutes bacterium]
MRNIKLTIAYDGTNYSGFQSQINALAVQDVLTRGLRKIFGEQIRLNAASRTDAGVHALGQVVNFRTSGIIPVERIVIAAATVLPKDLVVVEAAEESAEFHARKHAKKKTYRYRIRIADIFDPFRRNHCWQLNKALDIIAMNSAATQFIGEHDFQAFSSIKRSVKTTKRIIFCADWQVLNDELVFTICGSGFLYNMVRIIVGTCVDIGSCRRAVDDIAKIIESKNRELASPTAPAHGLCLLKVEY